MPGMNPLRTQADYEAAVTEVAGLWGAKSGTREGDRPDILATLIDAYEATNFAMDAPTPSEAMKFRKEQQGLTTRDTA